MFLLMTDGAWHCQGTVGQACASSMPPAPLLCTPPHKLQHAHTASLSHLAYLSWTLPPPTSPLCTPTPYAYVCLSITLLLSLSHTLAWYYSSSAHCDDDCLMDHCLRIDIYDTGKMCWMNCVCSGPDLISSPNKNACFMSPIQDELLCNT